MRNVQIKMNVYNAYHTYDEGQEEHTRNKDPRVHTQLAPLFAELAKKRPTWKFMSKGYGDIDSENGAFYYYKRFTIMEGSEELGEVWADRNWRTNEPRYAFDNARLKDARLRGNCTETKDMKKAVKLILANMYARTVAEVMAHAQRLANGKARDAIGVIQREHYKAQGRIHSEMEAFVVANQKVFEAQFRSSTVDIKQYVESYERQKHAAAVDAALKNNKFAVVAEHNDQFHIEYAGGNGTFYSCTLDDMPAHLKQAVAILKLVGNDTLVDGIGVAAGKKLFFVTKGLSDE